MNHETWLRQGRIALTLAVCSALACVDEPGADSEPAGGSTAASEGVASDASSAGAGAPEGLPGGAVLDAGEGEPAPAGAVPDAELLVALVGDQGTGSDTKAVYELLLAEKADLVILLGDFDYKNDPAAWESEMKSVLPDEFPVFAVVGNHDVKAWKGYQSRLLARQKQVQGAVCTGDFGVDASCTYRGLHFVLSGLGTTGTDKKHEKFITDALAADGSLWSLCTLHKTQRDLQAGDKPDEIGWKGLRACQEGGAIVVMGHEHSYARTRTLTDLGNEPGGHGAVGAPELLEVGPGRTFTAVSGLGGKSIRAYDAKLHGDDTWWATLFTSNYHLRNGVKIEDFSADSGALFIRFHVDADPKRARGYFKTVKGDVVDEFDVVHQ